MSWFHGTKNGTHASTGESLPVARANDLVIEEVGDELLIYDKTTNRAHSLSATAAKVWRACDGYTNTAVLCTKLDLDSETLAQALYELDNSSLLEETPQLGHTRREMTVKAAKFGAAASIPFIYSVVGPIAMAAATPTPQQCLFYSTGDCHNCSKICGCCCCCQGCSNFAPSCKVCYPTSLCNTANTGSKCVGVTGSGGCTNNAHCSDTANANPPGCVVPCSESCTDATGSALCGCASVETCV